MSRVSLTASLRATAAVFERGGAPKTTPEVAAALDLGRRTAYNRLDRLVDEDVLETKKVGANARVWWQPGTDDADRVGFDSLVDAVDESAVFVLDTEGHVRSWNSGAERIEGYAAEDILGEHFAVFYPEDQRQNGVPEVNLATAASEGSVEDKGWRVRADGDRFWADVTITAIRGDDGELQGFIQVIRDMSDRRERERQLRRERDLIQRLFEAAPAHLAVVRRDGSVERANAGARHALGLEGERPGVGGLDVASVEEPTPATERPIEHVVETGEPITDWLVTTEDGNSRWLSLTVAPVSDDEGFVERVVVAGTDITEVKRSERQRDQLEQELADVFGRIDDAFLALDEEWRFTHVNNRAEEVLGRSAEDLLHENVWEVFPEAVGSTFQEQYEHALETQESVSFEEYYPPLETWFEVTAYPSADGLSVYFRDVTERKAHERELERSQQRYRTLVDHFPNGAVALVNEEFVYTTFGGTPEGDTDLTSAALEGEPVREVLPEQIASVVVPRYEAALAGESAEFEATIDDRDYQFHFVPVRDDEGEPFAAMGMSQDITERKEYQRHLEDAKAQLEAATEAGAIGTWEWEVGDAVVADPSLARTFGVDPEAAREGVPIERFLSAIHDDDRERVVGVLEAALDACGEFEVEYRVQNAEGEFRWVMARGEVKCEDGDPVTFPGAITDITDRKLAELEVERQRAQLAALNNLNEVVRSITSAVIEQSTRGEIEQTVCDRLAATDSYLFAWVGEADSMSQTVSLRAEAGVEDYLDGVTISVDPDDEHSGGPTGRALQTGEIQTTTNARDDEAYEPWQATAESYGFRSSAAVPIVHEETVYGVLNIYTDRLNGFEGAERDLLGQLGEVVGHAIAAVDRKQALMSDEVVELEFQIDGIFETLGVDERTDDPIRLEHTVATGHDQFIFFGRTTADGANTIERMVNAVSFYESVSLRRDDDEVRFQIRVSEPPVLSVIASLGGSVEDAVIDDGEYRLRVHLSPGADVRKLIDTMQATYPGVSLLKRQQLTKTDTQEWAGNITAGLTDRQRTVLEAAYYAGFFEWPRDASGEDLAESLDIAAPTFHQHLRKAERKVFDSVLEGSELSLE